MSFDLNGYLGCEAKKAGNSFMARNCKIALLYKSINRWIQKEKFNFKSHIGNAQELLLNMLLGKSLETYQSIYVLMENGIYDSPQTLLRQLYEIRNKAIYASLSTDHTNKVICTGILEEIKTVNNVLNNPEDYSSKYDLDEFRNALPQKEERLKQYGDHKKPLSPWQIANEIGVNKDHKTIYASLCEPAHAGMQALDKYLDDKGLTTLPRSSNTIKVAILFTAITFMLEIVQKVSEIHKVDLTKSITIRSNRNNRLSEYYLGLNKTKNRKTL